MESGYDFHFKNVKERILEVDAEINVETFPVHDILYLKLSKRRNPTTSFLSFNPLVYTLLNKTERNSLKILFMSYNEEVLEELVVEVEEKIGLEESIINHICNSLNRQFNLCVGVPNPTDLSNAGEINNILIEKYGENIIFRSRNCSRILFEGESSECFECNLFKTHPDVKVKSENSNTTSILNEFESYTNDSFIDNSDDSDFRERDVLKRERKKAKLKLKDEEANSHFNCLLDDCHTSFTKEPAYVSHLLRTHPGKGLEAVKQWHKCPEDSCYKVFRDPCGKNMINHMQKFHKDNPDVRAEKEKNNICSYCSKKFTHSSYLKKHVETEHEAPVVPCHICGAFIKGHKTLNVHIRVVHGNQMYNCPEPGCDVKAKNKDHIKDHYAAIHKNEPRYICSVCGTRYKYRNKWKYCEDKHKGKFLHACLQCDKKFNDKRKYQIHQRVHSGEKPFMCPICSIRMARLDNLNAHTKKTHGVTWREAERMTQSTIGAAPLPMKTTSDAKVDLPVQPANHI